ncbi:hypothetical protein NSPZN2_160007 [Nitrospira defluvii]|uniref:Uncharacterized protein n=1 Tax=Nitrospira defluvii TaxID=330214 RepID=A0ABM8RB60_9BACT|nr:hypothetical protein NSPZN2_160007 [Nitrospira defluvii]
MLAGLSRLCWLYMGPQWPWACAYPELPSGTFLACMAGGGMVLFAVSRWGLVRDALK